MTQSTDFSSAGTQRQFIHFPQSSFYSFFRVGTSTWLQHFLSLRNLTKKEEENVQQGNFHTQVTLSTLPTIIFQTQGVASFLSQTLGAFNATASTGYDILFDGLIYQTDSIGYSVNVKLVLTRFVTLSIGLFQLTRTKLSTQEINGICPTLLKKRRKYRQLQCPTGTILF